MRSLVIFDLDGTLVDSFADIQAALNHGLERHGLPLHSLETVRSFVGNGLSMLVERALPPEALGLHASVLADTRQYYADHPNTHVKLYDGMREAVEAVRAAGHATAILSNKPDPLVQPIADALGLRALFDAIQGEQPGIAMKPDPEAVALLRRATGARDVVVVGDGEPDAALAGRAGAGFVGVAWGIVAAPVLAAHGAVAMVPGEIPALVERAFAALHRAGAG